MIDLATEDVFYEKAEKYEHLVWYARSGCRFDHHPPEIKAKVFKARENVERLYPKETTHYNDCGGDWDHGFNSGCLAAFRYVLSALDKDLGVPLAEEEFPNLDT